MIDNTYIYQDKLLISIFALTIINIFHKLFYIRKEYSKIFFSILELLSVNVGIFLILYYNDALLNAFGLVIMSTLYYINLKIKDDINAEKVLKISIVADMAIAAGLTISYNYINNINYSFVLILFGILLKNSHIIFLIKNKRLNTFFTSFSDSIITHTACLLIMVKFFSINEVNNFIEISIISVGYILLIFSIINIIFESNIYNILAIEANSVKGLIFLLIGHKALSLSIIIIITHMFFKNSFIILVRNITTIMSGEQNLTKMGGIYKKAYITYVFTVGTFFCLLSMWVLVDFLTPIKLIHYKQNVLLLVTYITFIILSIMYLNKLILLIFEGKHKFDEHVEAYLKEVDFKKHFPVAASLISGIFAFIYFINLEHTVPNQLIDNQVSYLMKFILFSFITLSLFVSCFVVRNKKMRIVNNIHMQYSTSKKYYNISKNILETFIIKNKAISNFRIALVKKVVNFFKIFNVKKFLFDRFSNIISKTDNLFFEQTSTNMDALLIVLFMFFTIFIIFGH